MRINGEHISTFGFGAAWLYSDAERWIPRGRDYHLGARRHACETCGAKPGEPCTRLSLSGRVVRQLPHTGRSPPLHSVTALNRIRELEG
jgi:hypothetical protein